MSILWPLALGFSLVFAAEAVAEEKKQELPPLTVESSGKENCVDVEIGNAKTYDCLNEKMQKKSDSIVRQPNLPPIDAHAPDVKTGTVNIPAVRQQYGPNFGKSVVPYRGAPPHYAPLR